MGKKIWSCLQPSKTHLRTGFALWQVMLTLVVVMTISIASLQLLEAQKIELEAQATLKGALQHYELVQKEAVLRGQPCEVQFYGNQIRFAYPGCQPATFVLPEETYFTAGRILRIWPNTGSVQPATITLKTPARRIEIRFQLGSGQYVYEEF